MFKSTMPTLKCFPVAIRLPFFRVNVMATRAHLAGIGRGDKHDWYTSKSKFIKCPVVGFAPFLFGAWLLIERLSNIGQILKCQRCAQLFRLRYKFFTDVVVNPFLEPAFSAREPSQELPATPSAFALLRWLYPCCIYHESAAIECRSIPCPWRLWLCRGVPSLHRPLWESCLSVECQVQSRY